MLYTIPFFENLRDSPYNFIYLKTREILPIITFFETMRVATYNFIYLKKREMIHIYPFTRKDER